MAELVGIALREGLRARRRHQAAVHGTDMAVDFGATFTAIYLRGGGVALCEPSVVAVDASTGELRACGSEAAEALDVPDSKLSAAWPLKDGVVAGLELGEKMLRHWMGKVQPAGADPRVLICVPPGLTEEERLAVQQACLAAGGREGTTIEMPLAAAIGAASRSGKRWPA